MNWLEGKECAAVLILPWILPITYAVGFLVLIGLVYVGWRFIRRRAVIWPKPPGNNGIHIGALKVYDNRSLALMLGQLQDQLQAIQSIDDGSLKASLGSQQSEHKTSLSGSLSVSPTVATDPGAKKSSDGSSKTSAATSDGGKSDKTQAQAAAAPTGSSPLKWSERGADLLADQVNLSYQIFSLRLLLERAVSDRLRPDGQMRIQAVIGVPISIDPPAFAIGAAATVEIRLTSEAGAPSLVALFPQEETYNTWGFNTKLLQLGASGTEAPVSAVAQGQASAENSYLLRHADVVALQRPSSRPNELIVAWQFRPSPGDRTVSAGTRQMMALVALADADAESGAAAPMAAIPGIAGPVVPRAVQAAAAVEPRKANINVNVHTEWSRWKNSSQTASASPGWRAAFSDRKTGESAAQLPLEIPTTDMLESLMAPTVAKIQWFHVGDINAGILLYGTNFFPGTSVVMGDTVLDKPDAMIIKSERSLQIIAPKQALLNEAILNGRYGSSIHLTTKPPDGLTSLRLLGASLRPEPGNQAYAVQLELETKDHAPLDWDLFVKLPEPIFAINGRVPPGHLNFQQGKANYAVKAGIRVTVDFVPSKSALIVMRWPFFGEEWSLSFQTYDPQVTLSVSRFSTATTCGLLMSGMNFSDQVQVFLDQPYTLTSGTALKRRAEDLLELTVPPEVVASYQQCFVTEPQAATLIAQISPAAPVVSTSVDLSRKPPTVAATGGTVDYIGTSLDKVTAVNLGATSLPFSVYDSGRGITISVGAEALDGSAKQEIKLLAGTTTLAAPLFIDIIASAAKNQATEEKRSP